MKLRSKGICILAGAGPGDIGLVTLRTKEAVELAEVIVYDYLCITPRFLNRRRRKQELSLTLIGPPDRRVEAFSVRTRYTTAVGIRSCASLPTWTRESSDVE